MRFLCLHGIGSNSRILQQQTAAIRYELGNRHSYDFVDGSLPWEADPALKEYILDGEEVFSYFDPTSPESCLQVARDLERYVATEGPYDGIMGFSVGANIAISWMLKLQRQNNGRVELPFKVGIFFSHTIPMYDLAALDQGRIVHMGKITDCLDVPTAHIWGVKDTGQEHAQIACRLCKADKRSVYVHGKSHGISTSVDDTIGMVKMINRAISSAEG